MKEIINKLLTWLNEQVINLINKLFNKVEDNIPDDLGAMFYGPMEADPRDFKVENVLNVNKYKDIKEKVDLIKEAKPTWYKNQGQIPCCTAAALSNAIAVSENIERAINDTEVKCCELRNDMGHKCQSNERGDYLEHALKTLKKNGVNAILTSEDGWSQKQVKLTIEGYAYTETTVDNMKKLLSAGFPLYYAFRGNKQTWIEMSKGEIKTTNFTPTGGHAVIATGYDKYYLYFMNSWRANDGDKYKQEISTFKISWSNLKEMLKYGLANRRFWIFYNTKDLPDNNKQMFKDYNIDTNTEAGQAVSFMAEKGIVKGVPHEDGTYLEPGRPVSRLELIVMLYRLIKYIVK